MLKAAVDLDLKIRVLLPLLPNFLKLEGVEDTIPVERLTDEQLRDLGTQWTHALVDHARKRREAKP